MTNIVMVVKDRYHLTRQALETLSMNTQEEYNLTLVDDRSLDFRVVRLLADEARLPRTTLIRLQKSDGVIARAKNIGVEWSKQTFGEGDYLYLSDNDVYFKPGWLSTLVSMATPVNSNVYGIYAGQVHPFHWQKDQPYQVVDGPSWLLHWPTWYACGPFQRDCAPGPCQSEEYPFCTKLLQYGGCIQVAEPHVVLHTGLTNTRGERAPGYEERKALMEPGVLYE